MAPEAVLSHLHRADGSATYTQHGYSIIGAVNGPLEVQRRDEMPEEATIEVNIRPASGVGTPKERHLETIVHNTLRSIILTRSIPRTLVQITLQIKSLPDAESDTGVDTSLTLLPHLLHTSLLALLSASIPLSTILTSVLVALPVRKPGLASDLYMTSPSTTQLLRSQTKSAHVFAFAGDGKLLLNESEGAFTYNEWEQASRAAQTACCGGNQEGEDSDDEDGGVALGDGMEVDGKGWDDNLERWLRQTVRQKVTHEQRWRIGT